MIPRFRDDTDKPGNDRRVEKVLHMPFGITISFKNLKAKDEKILSGSIMSTQILQLILKLFLFKPKASRNTDNINTEMSLNEIPLQTGLSRNSASPVIRVEVEEEKTFDGVWAATSPGLPSGPLPLSALEPVT